MVFKSCPFWIEILTPPLVIVDTNFNLSPKIDIWLGWKSRKIKVEQKVRQISALTIVICHNYIYIYIYYFFLFLTVLLLLNLELWALGWRPFRTPNWLILTRLERSYIVVSKASSLVAFGVWTRELYVSEVGLSELQID